jgi:class I fructose-bisphosphate aldolase
MLKLKVSLEEILEDGRGILLAYDHGIEHGPTDFNDVNFNPEYIMQIAKKGRFHAVVFQKGIAERYYDNSIPLLVKLNGKTMIPKGEPVSRQICSVEYAVSLGAKAVGYTIYLGSMYESTMLQEFGRIQEDARKFGIPTVAWVYPRGEAVKDDMSEEIVAYAARVGLEIGADAVKVKYTGNVESFKWVVKCAGKVKVFMSGGPKTSTEDEFLEQVRGVMDAGASGIAVGRNVWQSKDPIKMAKALRAIVIDDKSLDYAIKILRD